MNVTSHLNAGGIALPPAQGRPSVVSDDEREQLKQLLAAKDAREQADAQRGTQPTDTESSESPESSPTEPSPTEPSESTPLESIESAMQQEPTPPQTQQPTPDASQASSGPSQATAPQEVAAPSSRAADPDSPMAADPNEIAALSASSAPNVPVLPEIDGEEDPRAMLEAMRKATRATSDGLVLKPLNVEEGPLPQRKADASSMKMSKMRQLDMGAGSMAMGVFFLILIIALLYFGATMLMGKFSTP